MWPCLGAGDDVFQWDPGDGSDTVEGQDGTDRMVFNGSAGAEIFDVSANGARVRFTRNLGNIVMDLDDVETLELNVLGSTDTVTVNDLTGTDLTSVNVDLAGTLGGTAGDAAADTIIVNGTQRRRHHRCRRRGNLGLRGRAAGPGKHHQLRRRQRFARHQRAGRRRWS